MKQTNMHAGEAGTQATYKSMKEGIREACQPSMADVGRRWQRGGRRLLIGGNKLLIDVCYNMLYLYIGNRYGDLHDIDSV